MEKHKRLGMVGFVCNGVRIGKEMVGQVEFYVL